MPVLLQVFIQIRELASHHIYKRKKVYKNIIIAIKKLALQQ